MKTFVIILFFLPTWAICQEEHEILNIGTRPDYLRDYHEVKLFNNELNFKAKELNERIERTLAKYEKANAAKVQRRTKKDFVKPLRFPSENQVYTLKEPASTTKENKEDLESQRRIQEFVDEVKRSSGGVAEQSTYLDTSSEIVPYSEVEKYIKSGVFKELGYARNRDNDAIYNERLKWYGGMDSGFFMNIVGSFMETILSLPQMIANLKNLFF